MPYYYRVRVMPILPVSYAGRRGTWPHVHDKGASPRFLCCLCFAFFCTPGGKPRRHDPGCRHLRLLRIVQQALLSTRVQSFTSPGKPATNCKTWSHASLHWTKEYANRRLYIHKLKPNMFDILLTMLRHNMPRCNFITNSHFCQFSLLLVYPPPPKNPTAPINTGFSTS